MPDVVIVPNPSRALEDELKRSNPGVWETLKNFGVNVGDFIGQTFEGIVAELDKHLPYYFAVTCAVIIVGLMGTLAFA